MAKSSIDIVISTILKKTGIDAAASALKSLGNNVKGFAASVGRNLANIYGGFQLVAKGAQTFLSAMSKGMEFERMTVQFKSLTGSMELARQHMKDLQDLGRTPPFSLEQFAAASQAMMKMTGGMAGFKEQMEIVGDMAAATGNDIATVGRAFGLAYQVIRDGQDFGRAGQQLYSLGLMTKAQVAEFAELSKAGTDNRAVLEKLTEVFSRYKGAMAETEKTTKGMVEAIQGEATVAMTEFSAAISESAKPALEGLLGYLKRINEDGTIEDWADSTVAKLNEVGKVAKTVGDAFGWFWKAAKTVGASVTGFRQGAKMADELGLTGDEKWAYARKFRSDVIDEIWGKNQEANEEKQDSRERRRAAKAKKRAEESAKAEAEAKRRIDEYLAAAQEKTNKRLDEEKKKKAAEEAQKAAEETKKAADAKLKAEQKAEAELHAQRLANIKSEIAAKESAANGIQSVAQQAQTEFDRAFAMYRDPEKAAAQIAEERDYAADYKQLQRDASRYGGKWRIDELSRLMASGDTQGQAATLEKWRKSSRFTPDVEAMVRAAAADKTRTTAEDELRKLNKTTEETKTMLEELLKMK